ncbi:MULTISPECIES: AMP-dependent synthetase/ligase [Hydrogenophaga]|uniref:Long-chain-fatty-acid--CoA ligase n=1 Tax=Hydrogenophaga electricum TaxID=1230953 RepID=A0ABQ6C9J5_9BURK|nr:MULTISPECIES: AMP-binding protein [Hydrogenophaga]GLS16489.1 long-chain-fatty-acid--CoA ligase [Hydrogenophaga electricum]
MNIRMATLPQLLRDHARRSPQRLSQRHKTRGIWREYDFSQVQRNVMDLALGLHKLGIQRGETVAIIGENEPQHYWAEYAAQAVGCKVISLYPDLTADEVQYLLDDSEAVCLFAQDQEQVDKGLAVKTATPNLRHIVYWDDTGMWSYQDPILRKFHQLQREGQSLCEKDELLYDRLVDQGRPDDIAVLSYTSGTTGKPKGVILSHRSLVDNAQRLVNATKARPGTQYLSYIAPAWATEQFMGLALGIGLPMVVNFPEGPEQVLENIRELAVEAMTFAPRQWESMASSVQAHMLDAGHVRRGVYEWGLKVGHAVHVARLDGKPVSWWNRALLPLADALVLRPLRDQLGLTRLRVAICGGATMAPDVFRMFHAMGVPLRNIYGSTEVGLLTSHQGDRFDLETVGHWMQTHPEAGSPLEWMLTADGELCVKGGSSFLGYYRREGSVEAKVKDGWYQTGDAVTKTDRGELVFLERVSDLKRLADGQTFPPQFVETRLRFSPFIKDIMTVGDERRDFVAALINIDMGVLSRWAEDKRIGFSTFTDLSQRPEVADLLSNEISRVNQFLPAHARVRRFANFPKELDPDEGELTRSRKLRREFLEDRYSALIQGLYNGASEVTVDIPVTYQDGRRSQFTAQVFIRDVAAADQTAKAGISNGRKR